MTRAAGSAALAGAERAWAHAGTLLVLAALALRLVWWGLYVRVIENEGVVYARLAQSLFSGEGMISI
ncbi:MAG TPA: hypothetical protein VLJ62_01855, partial [Burkholderiaceae bacterium]|nr:hypothetical protein [Burkholderiaceae bacterium]